MNVSIQVREMQKADLAAALEVIGKAFATQPNTLAVSGGKPVSPQKLAYAFEGRFKYLPGRLFVAELDGRIVGAMRMVEWPGCQASLVQTLKMMPSMLKAIGGFGEVSRGMKILNTWKKHDPKQPHWHLDPIGVTPELQGKGVGSRMMEVYCRIIDEKGMAAYHETDRPENVPFYERFGFAVIAEEEILGARNWFMWRKPR